MEVTPRPDLKTKIAAKLGEHEVKNAPRNERFVNGLVNAANRINRFFNRVSAAPDVVGAVVGTGAEHVADAGKAVGHGIKTGAEAVGHAAVATGKFAGEVALTGVGLGVLGAEMAYKGGEKLVKMSKEAGTRAVESVTGAADRLFSRIHDAGERFGQRVTEKRQALVNGARELAERGVQAGTHAVERTRDHIQAACADAEAIVHGGRAGVEGARARLHEIRADAKARLFGGLAEKFQDVADDTTDARGRAETARNEQLRLQQIADQKRDQAQLKRHVRETIADVAE